MHKTLRALPSLDFLRGFEAAGRRLSFTLAAEELFLTQSALSRQIKALEVALGIALFERRHRALALTVKGATFHRAVTEMLEGLASAAEGARSAARAPGVTVSTTVSFASLGIIPRLERFRARHPEIDVYVSADARTHSDARGTLARWPARRPVSQAVRFRARLFRADGPACSRAQRRTAFPKLADRRSGAGSARR